MRRDHASTPPSATMSAARSISASVSGCSSPRHLVQEERQRHAPVALPADAPVGPVRDHVVQPRAAVLGIERGRVDGVERALAQGLRRRVGGEHAARRVVGLVHADEPLRRGAVDDRRLVAPAVRIAVHERRAREQPARVAQRIDDRRLRLPDVQAAEQRQRAVVDAVALDRIEDVVDRQAVGAARVEVVDAVGRRRVDDAGAVFRGRVVGEVDRRGAVVARVDVGERMAKEQALEALARHARQHRARQAVARQALLDQRARQHEQAALGVDERVLELRVEVERLVGGDRPRRRRPDDGERVLGERGQAERRGEPVGLGGEEGDVDRRRGAIGVLDLELGERRAAVEAPVDRLQAAVDEAALDQALQDADLAGLVAEVHRPVRMVPVAEHADALEVGHLLGDLLVRVGAALRLHLVARQAAAELLLDRVLDRQAVAVPARRVARVEAGELARLDDHVLQDLVGGVADVQLAVRVRRAVVQDEARPAVAHFAQALVDAFVAPLLDPRRLALGQVAAHRERRVGQVQRRAVVDRRARVGRCGEARRVSHGESFGRPPASKAGSGRLGDRRRSGLDRSPASRAGARR